MIKNLKGKIVMAIGLFSVTPRESSVAVWTKVSRPAAPLLKKE